MRVLGVPEHVQCVAAGLVTAIAVRYGYRQNTAGTTFWFEVDL